MAQQDGSAAFHLIEGISRFTAHALGNPLTGLSLSLDLLASANLPEAQKRLVDRCIRVTERLTEYKENLGALGGSLKSVRETVPTEDFLREVVEAQHLGDVYKCTVEVAADCQRMSCFPPLMRDALHYLFRNSTDAMPEGGALGIRVHKHGERTRLTFWDEGPGLAEGAEQHLFHEPVPSRKHGGGFGLLLVAMIVAHIHGGAIAYEANAPSGCLFHLDFP